MIPQMSMYLQRDTREKDELMILPLTVQAPQGKGKLNVERRRKRRAMHVKRQTDRNMKKITTTVLMNL